uniref:Uncharacterized protein n=1 Tax=Knipowitschia caucasica TaxID=637954 RepID=A0AAV2MLY8_KNICA
MIPVSAAPLTVNGLRQLHASAWLTLPLDQTSCVRLSLRISALSDIHSTASSTTTRPLHRPLYAVLKAAHVRNPPGKSSLKTRGG